MKRLCKLIRNNEIIEYVAMLIKMLKIVSAHDTRERIQKSEREFENKDNYLLSVHQIIEKNMKNPNFHYTCVREAATFSLAWELRTPVQYPVRHTYVSRPMRIHICVHMWYIIHVHTCARTSDYAHPRCFFSCVHVFHIQVNSSAYVSYTRTSAI